MKVPPRWLVLLADWSNVFAGLVLCIAFALVVLVFTTNTLELADVGDAINFTFLLEGVLWALAAACLVRINIMTENAAGAVSQTIICFGGIFFTASGLNGVPANIISLKYVIPYEENAKFADACPYYGITCFMFATTMGMVNVWALPRTSLVSPFWGVACFFIGAWSIGIFGFWGPCLFGGNDTYEHLAETGHSKFEEPTFAWAWTHVIQLIGAVFLTVGGIIFGLLDNFLNLECKADTGLFVVESAESSESSDY